MSPVRRAETTCVFEGCGRFDTREAFLLHVMDCPHVFPAIQVAARKEYKDPAPREASPRGPAVHPDLFAPYDTSTLPKRVKGAGSSARGGTDG